MKKLIALILAVVMLLPVLAGCGNVSEPTEAPTDSAKNTEAANAPTEQENTGIVFPLEETMTFTGFAGMNGDYKLSETLTWKTALEKANINIELTEVLGSELAEKSSLLLNSGKYPDIFIKSAIDAEKYGLEGVLIPLEDLIREYMPNLTAFLDENDAWGYITAADGHVYGLPMGQEKKPRNNPLWLNQRWMDNLGLEMPTSYEELYEVLKAFKEQDANGNGDPNDEIPFIATTKEPVYALMAYQDYQFDRNTFMGVRDGELVNGYTDESMKELIAFITKLYSEGLMNSDAFTMTREQQRANGQSGDIYGAFHDGGAFQTVGRDNDDDYAIMTPFYEGTYPNIDLFVSGALVITDACENPEVILAWADYFYSEEGAILAWMGVEDVTYKKNSDGSWEWILDGEYGDDVAEVRGRGCMQGARPMPAVQPAYWLSMSASVDPDEVYLNSERKRVYDMGAVPMPALSFTEEEANTLATIEVDVEGYYEEYLAQVVTGMIDLEETWDDYLATMKAMRIDELFAIYQDAYARATAK